MTTIFFEKSDIIMTTKKAYNLPRQRLIIELYTTQKPKK